MDGLNKVQLIGNLGADPELKMTANGQAVMKLSLATTESWKDKDGNLKDRTEWHRVTVWGARAEGLAKFVRKGWRIYVEGRIEHDSYEKDGQKRYTTDVIANKVLVFGPPRSTADDGVPYVAPRSTSNGAFSAPPSRAQQDEIPF